jgi:hypothetical protein
VFRAGRFRRWQAAATVLASVLVASRGLNASKQPPTIEELKAQVSNASVGDRPHLCLEISERQLDAAAKFYDSGDSEKAKGALTDVEAFSELTRDYAIQSHKHEKQSEIAIRKMVRKLDDLKHTVSHEDQQTVQDIINRLQRVRDDLLAAMFPKGGNK